MNPATFVALCEWSATAGRAGSPIAPPTATPPTCARTSPPRVRPDLHAPNGKPIPRFAGAGAFTPHQSAVL